MAHDLLEGPVIEVPYYLGAKSEAARNGLLINLAQREQHDRCDRCREKTRTLHSFTQ